MECFCVPRSPAPQVVSGILLGVGSLACDVITPMKGVRVLLKQALEDLLRLNALCFLPFGTMKNECLLPWSSFDRSPNT